MFDKIKKSLTRDEVISLMYALYTTYDINTDVIVPENNPHSSRTYNIKTLTAKEINFK
jgi:hypothetical protein